MTDQKITMDGKWAYRHDPFTQVRVLCVDAGGNCPIASINPEGGAIGHIEGGQAANFDGEFDLVPLQEKRKPREVWIVERIGGLLAFYSEVDAENALRNYHQSHKPLRFREVTDEEPAFSTIETWKEGDDEINIYAVTEPMRTTERGE